MKKIFKKIAKKIVYSGTWAPQPSSLILEITSNCNLNCIMCSSREKRESLSQKNLSVNEFNYILNQLPKLKEVIILGQGESFMNSDIYKIMEAGKSKNIKFDIVTNGTLLTEDNIKKLPDNVRQIMVSIDSPISEKYEKIRGGKLAVVVENIKNLRRLKKNIYIRINVVIMEDNIEDLPKFSEFAQELGVDGINLSHLMSFNEFLDKKHGDNFINLHHKIEELKISAEKNKIKIEAQPLLTKPTRCLYPWYSIRMFLNGDYYSCCLMDIFKTREEYYQGIKIEVPQYQYKMGNIFTGNFKKIWNEKDYRLLRKTVKNSRNSVLLTPDEFNKKRVKTDLCPRFSYCKICPTRQNRF